MTVGELDIRTTPNVATGLNAAPPVPELQPINAELAFCQRYLPAFNSTAANSFIAPAFVGSGGTTLIGMVQFPVPTRAVPTGISASAGSTFSGAQASGNFAGTAIAIGSNIGTTGAQANVTVSGMTAGNGAALYFNGSSGQLLFTGAEL